jgi:hypothetical protein
MVAPHQSLSKAPSPAGVSFYDGDVKLSISFRNRFSDPSELRQEGLPFVEADPSAMHGHPNVSGARQIF